MIAISTHEKGVLLPVRAIPGAKRNEIHGEQDGALKVCVTQIPEKGKANQAIIKLLTKELGLRRSSFELISGAASSTKMFLVNISKEELELRLLPYLQKK